MMKDETTAALAKHFGKVAPRLPQGVYLVDETVTIKVKGTLKVGADTSAKEPLPWKAIASLAWGRLSTQDRLDIVEHLNGARKVDSTPVEQDLGTSLILEDRPRAGATTATVLVEAL
jgi:hypothetical protein